MPEMVADAGPSSAALFNLVKWFTASGVALWQTVHALDLCSARLWLLDDGPLNCEVPNTWQLVHWVSTVSVPVRQLGVAWPP